MNQVSKAPLMIVLHETIFSSWIKDGMSVGLLALLIYVNHVYGQGSGIVDTFGVFLAFSWLMGKAVLLRGSGIMKFHSRRDLALWLVEDGKKNTAPTA